MKNESIDVYRSSAVSPMELLESLSRELSLTQRLNLERVIIKKITDEDVFNFIISSAEKINLFQMRAVIRWLCKGNYTDKYEDFICQQLLFSSDDSVSSLVPFIISENLLKKQQNIELINKFILRNAKTQKVNRWLQIIELLKNGSLRAQITAPQIFLYTINGESDPIKTLLISNLDSLKNINNLADLNFITVNSYEVAESLFLFLKEHHENLSEEFLETINNNYAERIKNEFQKEAGRNTEINKERLESIALFSMIGDILGAPIETMPKEKIRKRFGKVTTLVFPEEVSRPIGSYTDDTEMSLILLKNYRDNGYFDLLRYKGNLREVVIENNKSDIRGYSQAMLRSINKYSLGINRKFCGENRAGSGALMFAYPIGIFNTEEEKIDKEVEKIISITHSSEKSLFAAKVYCNLIAYLLNNREATRKSIVEKIEQLLDKKAITEDEKEVRENIKEVLSLIDVNDVDYVEEKIGNSGYVVETLNFSLYCFLKNLDNPRQAIIDAINIAGDSDTIGAITGALVGSLHNFSDNPEVPEEWHGLVKNFRKELEC